MGVGLEKGRHYFNRTVPLFLGISNFHSNLGGNREGGGDTEGLENRGRNVKPEKGMCGQVLGLLNSVLKNKLAGEPFC